MGLVDKKIAVVTGGAQGIGAAIVGKLASEGASIAVVDINGEKAKEVALAAQQKGVETESYQVDVSDTEAVKTPVAEIVKRFGRVDVLVDCTPDPLPTCDGLADAYSIDEGCGLLQLRMTASIGGRWAEIGGSERGSGSGGRCGATTAAWRGSGGLQAGA